jgi:NlpE N-terminal domain
MKRIAIVKFLLLLLIAISPGTLPAPAGSSPLGAFVATSPCDAGSRSLLQIPKTADCEMIKWSLTFYQDSSALTPTTYQLDYVYGLPQPNTNRVAQGGIKVRRTGKWMIVRGTKTNPNAIVYQLDPDKSQASVSLQVVDHNLLHLLDRDEKMMVGNAGWSYTFNRIGDFARQTQPAPQPANTRAKAVPPVASALPPSANSSILARYEGRSPCREVARELNRAVEHDCLKLKWDLTLHQNPTTGIPTTYTLKGTFYRQRIGEGKWVIIKGTKTNPDAVVYQLDPDKAQGSLFFLKADENILFFLSKEKTLLVGNGDFSYTLNKGDDVLKN